MGRRDYEDEEEGPEEEEFEEEDPEEGDEEDEPEEMLWRSSTTVDYDGTVRTIALNNLVTTAERNKDG
jgi:hypothetical protein